MTIRTPGHMTIIEAHPFHGQEPEQSFTPPDLRVNNSNRRVFLAYDAHCPLCRNERTRRVAVLTEKQS